jgi:hypothetical protein
VAYPRIRVFRVVAQCVVAWCVVARCVVVRCILARGPVWVWRQDAQDSVTGPGRNPGGMGGWSGYVYE